MERKTYEEIVRMQRQFELESEQLLEKLQAIQNYRTMRVPGNVRVAALRRAKETRTFLDGLIEELQGEEQR